MTNKEAALLFRTTASLLEQQGDATYGGAFLAVPPEGDPIDLIMTTSKPDIALFWTMLEGKIAIVHEEMAGRNQPFGRRR